MNCIHRSLQKLKSTDIYAEQNISTLRIQKHRSHPLGSVVDLAVV